MHKKGITLLELMLVVAIISFISISTITGFSVSSERLKFQNQLNTLESFLTSHRAKGFNDTTGNNDYSIIINQNQIQAISADAITGVKSPNPPLTLNIPNEDMNLLQFNGRSTNSSWAPIPNNQKVEIKINSQQRLCQIFYNNQELLILHIPISKANQNQASKHLYIHRSNCLIESLNDQIQN